MLHMLRGVIAGIYFSCEGKQILRRVQFFMKFSMNMKIAANFEVVKLG